MVEKVDLSFCFEQCVSQIGEGGRGRLDELYIPARYGQRGGRAENRVKLKNKAIEYPFFFAPDLRLRLEELIGCYDSVPVAGERICHFHIDENGKKATRTVKQNTTRHQCRSSGRETP